MIRSSVSVLSFVPARLFHSSSRSFSGSSVSAANGNGVSSPSSSSSSSDSPGRVLIYGGNGALGRSLVHHFRREHWQVISVDFSANSEAWLSITLHPETHWKDNTMLVIKRLQEKIGSSSTANKQSPSHSSPSSSLTHHSSNGSLPQPDGSELNVVINAAGGWAGGDIASTNFFHSVDQMWQVNALSALSTAYIAGQCMRLTAYPLVVFTGASPVFHGGTPGMVGYGVAKAAIHHLLLSMAAMPLHAPANYTKASTPPPALPSTAVVTGLLPITIDTPSNRAAMPNADFTQWTPPHLFAETVVSWALALRAKRKGETIDALKIDSNAPHAPYLMPVNGGFYEFSTKNGKTSIQLHELFGQGRNN